MTRVLVTGQNGYIGSVLAPMLQDAGHEVVGLDSDYFDACRFGLASEATPRIEAYRRDMRDLQPADVPVCDAVMHLAALSNDALGTLDPAITDAVNHRASVRLAEMARAAGASRFIFSSSCSLYGAAEGDELLTEEASFNPVTPYGRSKVDAEAGIRGLATDDFSPVYLRNATAYGPSPRLRGDLVVNELVARAHLDGRVQLNSDGMAWRPLVHVEDIARAFIAALEAPREVVHNEAFNVGASRENYTVREIAEMVCDAVPDSTVTFGEGAGADKRSYRVSFDKIAEALPAARPQWTLRQGIQQLLQAYRTHGITLAEILQTRYSRIAWLRAQQEAGRLDEALRWLPDAEAPRASGAGTPAATAAGEVR
ncbi:MAG: NAD(P)-dependent oxidoreductase [Dehalococcoidia bacterium]|nr:NAD(P)-dependent oxidoreductase [Dehalococcoidia bacterium]